MESSSSEFNEKPAVHEHQPRLNEVAQKFLADLDEERQRLSAEFPLCALLIDEGKGLHFIYLFGPVLKYNTKYLLSC